MSRALANKPPHKLTKEYLSGNTTPEFLSIFSQTEPGPLLLLTPKNYESLCAWNNLQNTPNKRRNFTFTVFEGVFEMIQPYFKGYCPKWAYILHDKDDSGHKHYHLYVEYENPRSFASVANDLHIPVNQLQGVISKRGILSYLTHDNEADKHHYDLSEVVANFDIVKEKQEEKIDVIQIAKDYAAMREGRMSYLEFLQCHENSISRQSFSSVLQICEKSYNACSHFERAIDGIQPSFSGVRKDVLPVFLGGSKVDIPLHPPVTRSRKSYAKPNPRSDLS